MIFGIKENQSFQNQFIFGYCYKYTPVTSDWFCGPGSHMLSLNHFIFELTQYHQTATPMSSIEIRKTHIGSTWYNCCIEFLAKYNLVDCFSCWQKLIYDG